MHQKFEINRTKIKGGCQSGRKVLLTHNSKSDLPLEINSPTIALVLVWKEKKMTKQMLDSKLIEIK